MSSKIIILTSHTLFLVVRSMGKKEWGKCLAATPSSFFLLFLLSTGRASGRKLDEGADKMIYSL
jgi:4-amino-4-deoxy-L-arabinose transferase-like glycosyltransferase